MSLVSYRAGRLPAIPPSHGEPLAGLVRNLGGEGRAFLARQIVTGRLELRGLTPDQVAIICGVPLMHRQHVRNAAGRIQ